MTFCSGCSKCQSPSIVGLFALGPVTNIFLLAFFKGNIPSLFFRSVIECRAASRAVCLCCLVKMRLSTLVKSTYRFSKRPSLNLARKIFSEASFTRSIDIRPSFTSSTIFSKKCGPCICMSIPASTDKKEASLKFSATRCNFSIRSISIQSLT